MTSVGKLKPCARRMLIADTTDVISSDRMSGMTTALQRLGSLPFGMVDLREIPIRADWRIAR